jgi:hypothetical protein
MLGKYPFLTAARELARAKGLERIGFEDLEGAKRRVFDAVNRAAAKEFPVMENPSDESSVISYALGRLLLAINDSDYYWQKFSRGEAVLAMQYLAREPAPGVLKVARDFFPSIAEAEGGYSIPMAEYLAYGSQLPSTRLSAGLVSLTKRGLFELLKNAVARRAKEKPPAVPKNDLFKSAAEELKASLPKPIVVREYEGSHLTLPCVKAVLAGAPEGKRYYGSMVIANACRTDGLGKAAATAVMQEFVNNCGKQTHPFTMREAEATLEWVYRRPPFFNCNAIRQHGLAPDECAFPCTRDRAKRRK